MDLFEREQFKEVLRNLKENEDLLIEQASMSAKMLFIYFNALKDEGFTEEQAIRLVAKHGISMGYNSGDHQ